MRKPFRLDPGSWLVPRVASASLWQPRACLRNGVAVFEWENTRESFLPRHHNILWSLESISYPYFFFGGFLFPSNGFTGEVGSLVFGRYLFSRALMGSNSGLRAWLVHSIGSFLWS